MKSLLSLLFACYSFGILASEKSVERLTFSYTIVKDTVFENSYIVHGDIKNVTSETIYFLSESCNGLDYDLSTSNPKGQIDIIMHCFVSLPEKCSIKANDHFTFRSRIALSSPLKEIALSLNLYELSANEEIKDESIASIIMRKRSKVILLQGPTVQLKD